MDVGALTKMPISSRILDKVKEIINTTHCNGGIIIECFKVNDTDLIEKFEVNEEFEPHFTDILTSEDIRDAIPQLGIGDRIVSELNLKMQDSNDFNDIITSLVCHSGAYICYAGSHREAKEIGKEFSEFILGDRYRDVYIFYSSNYWCSWFCDKDWDQTWFILDTKLERIWLICVTDTV